MNNTNYFNFESTPINASIGILGGSYDPPHLGHAFLALSFLGLVNIDELWIVPCNDHAIKKNITSFAHRLAMCQLAFRNFRNTRVLDIESKLKAPNYTIETIKIIKKHRPDLKLTLGLGSDIISDFARWHKSQELSLSCNFAIFQREHYEEVAVPSLLSHAEIYDGFALPDINSTDLRELLINLDQKPQCSLLDRFVEEYIRRHSLYSLFS